MGNLDKIVSVEIDPFAEAPAVTLEAISFVREFLALSITSFTNTPTFHLSGLGPTTRPPEEQALFDSVVF